MGSGKAVIVVKAIKAWECSRRRTDDSAEVPGGQQQYLYLMQQVATIACIFSAYTKIDV